MHGATIEIKKQFKYRSILANLILFSSSKVAYRTQLILILRTRWEMRGQFHAPNALPLEEECRRLVGPRTILHTLANRKISAPVGS
jgi:hypothetical protein